MEQRQKIFSINFVLKVVLATALLALLYYNLTRQNSLDQMIALFKQQLSNGSWHWIAYALILLPFNWLTETLKWQPYLAKFEPISLWRGFQAVLAGVSFSLFTPNRVGEYGGRVLFVSAEHRWKAFIINIVGNFSQILVILTFGLCGALWLYQAWIKPDVQFFYTAVAFSILIVSCIAIGFFNIDIFIPLARRVPYVHKIKRYVKDIAVLRQFNNRQLAGILFWSGLRFLIYSTQYFCVLRFYGIEARLIEMYSAIFTIFLLQTGIPLPPVLGLVARGSVAVQIFAYFNALPLSALAATFTLWVINLIIPSLSGIGFILNINLARIIGYDKK